MSEQSQPNHERSRSFDMLASVDMIRVDLANQGHVHLETHNRIVDEECTLIAEGLDRPLRTEFTLSDLYGTPSYFDRGAWRSYIAVFINGARSATDEARMDYRRKFHANRASYEEKEGLALMKLSPGQSLVSCSPYPEEVERIYGGEFLMRMGYKPDRKMGFIRISTKQLDGRVRIVSHSVDNSDLSAFAAVQDHLGNPVEDNLLSDEYLNRFTVTDQRADVDELLSIYDTHLTAKHEHPYYAGRRLYQDVHETNGWEELKQHADVLSYFFDNIYKLANSTGLSRDELEITKRRLTYRVWATIKGRADEGAVGEMGSSQAPYDVSHIEQELQFRYRAASSKKMPSVT